MADHAIVLGKAGCLQSQAKGPGRRQPVERIVVHQRDQATGLSQSPEAEQGAIAVCSWHLWCLARGEDEAPAEEFGVLLGQHRRHACGQSAPGLALEAVREGEAAHRVGLLHLQAHGVQDPRAVLTVAAAQAAPAGLRGLSELDEACRRKEPRRPGGVEATATAVHKDGARHVMARSPLGKVQRETGQEVRRCLALQRLPTLAETMLRAELRPGCEADAAAGAAEMQHQGSGGTGQDGRGARGCGLRCRAPLPRPWLYRGALAEEVLPHAHEPHPAAETSLVPLAPPWGRQACAAACLRGTPPPPGGRFRRLRPGAGRLRKKRGGALAQAPRAAAVCGKALQLPLRLEHGRPPRVELRLAGLARQQSLPIP
mmetsp:Transcript_85985/g.266260  ORF Transcript_85985/g.266260 Transcript_85985/m.266260 type:complete len:371 (-) Transcript_85985:1421-2533(-)